MGFSAILVHRKLKVLRISKGLILCRRLNGRGVVSSRVALLLRSAETLPRSCFLFFFSLGRSGVAGPQWLTLLCRWIIQQWECLCVCVGNESGERNV